jgi:hypothetical protein
MMLLAEYEDVVAKRLEAKRGVPHVLRHPDAFANLILALDGGGRMLPCVCRPFHASRHHQPDNESTRCRCQGLAPNTPYLFPFPRQRVVQNQNSKVSPEVPGRF